MIQCHDRKMLPNSLSGNAAPLARVDSLRPGIQGRESHHVLTGCQRPKQTSNKGSEALATVLVEKRLLSWFCESWASRARAARTPRGASGVTRGALVVATPGDHQLTGLARASGRARAREVRRRSPSLDESGAGTSSTR